MPTEKHQKQARSILTTVHTHCCCAICEDSIVAALESAYAEGGHAEFDRGWRHAEGEIAAAIPCDYKSLHGGKLWVVKMEELIRSAEERGKRDAAARCAEMANGYRTVGAGSIGPLFTAGIIAAAESLEKVIRAEFGIEVEEKTK